MVVLSRALRKSGLRTSDFQTAAWLLQFSGFRVEGSWGLGVLGLGFRVRGCRGGRAVYPGFRAPT